MGGAGIGFSLALSLRRYTSFITHKPSMLTITTDMTLISIGFISSYIGYGVNDYAIGSNSLRKELLLANDRQYLENCKERFEKFPEVYDYQLDLFRYLFNQDEFQEWQKTTPFVFNPPAEEQVREVQRIHNEQLQKKKAVLEMNDRK